jgi:DNA repair protein RAD51
MVVHISTGSRALDALLDGGIRIGMLTDVYGHEGSGKSQLCFTLCANCAYMKKRVLFIDTTGTFRPERISEIARSTNVLDNVTVIRALNTEDQIAAIDKAADSDADLIIVDSLTSLFSAEYSGPSRHLAVMNHMHELALLAINAPCAIVATNMVRMVPQEEGRGTEREYLSSTVSIHAHMRLKFSIENAAKSSYIATLVQPPGDSTRFSISRGGIQDAD